MTSFYGNIGIGSSSIPNEGGDIVEDSNFYFIENEEEFFSSSEAEQAEAETLAVNPATGKMYYKSYTGEWLLWGSESGSGSDTPSEVTFAMIEDGDTTTIQATWQEIYNAFNAGSTVKLSLDGNVRATVNDVGIDQDADPVEYVVIAKGNGAYAHAAVGFRANRSDSYPSATRSSGPAE